MQPIPVEILKKQLREKFPQAHGSRAEPRREGIMQDLSFEINAFPMGALSEVVPACPGAGVHLLIAALLGEPEKVACHPELVLVDGNDSFDPDSFSDTACSKLLWVRCRSAIEMAKAGDLMIQDGNIPFILLDAASLAGADLAKLPASTWWRMKQAAERTGCRVVVMTPSPMIPCASLRLALSAHLTLQDFDLSQGDLVNRLRPVAEPLRRAT